MPDLNPKIILLVEDEAIIALSEMDQLEREGYQVLHALNGERAIRMVCQNRQHADLILMDIDLGPGIDGTETARQILKYYDIPIVFLSSHRETEIVAKTEKITSYGYVVKTSSPTVLLASIKMAFKLHEAHTLLKESEEKYRRLIEGAPDIVYTFSKKHGGIYYSPYVTQVLGYSLDNMYAHPYLWSESVHPDDRAQVSTVLEEFENGIPFDIQYRIKNASGDWLWLRDRSIGRLLKDDDVLIEGLATDITANKHAEDTLRQSEQCYRDLIANSTTAIFQSTLGGQVISVNSKFAQMFGYASPEELFALVKDIAQDIFAEPDRRAELIRVRTADPSQTEFTNRYRRKDGSLFLGCLSVRTIQDQHGQDERYQGSIEFISDETDAQPIGHSLSPSTTLADPQAKLESLVNARTIHLQSIIDQLRIEIQEHTLAEGKLSESAEGFRYLFENAPDAIFLADPESGIILDANVAASRLIDLPREEIRGMHHTQLHPPKTESFSEESFDQHITEAEAQGFTHPIENVALRSDGSQVPIEVVAQVIKLQNRPVLMGTFRDISQRKQVEEKLLESDRHARALFDNSPLGLREEDFSEIKKRFDELTTAGVVDLRKYLDENPDEVTQLAIRIKILSVNQVGVALLGPLDNNPHLLPGHFTRASLEIFKEEMIALAAGHTRFAAETPLLDPYGQIRIFFMSLIVMPGFEASLGRVIVAFNDITDRKQAEDKITTLLHEKDILLKEVHHRVKNNMNSISSLLHLQMNAEKIPSARLAIQDAEARVRSMTVLYDKLYRSPNFNSVSIRQYFPPLLHEITELFHSDIPIELTTDFEDIILLPRQLSPLGLILNELATNAIKHAFVGRASGKLIVTATKKSNIVSILFKDNGVGLPQTASLENLHGFGMQLIGLLVKQIDGEVMIKRENGTTFMIKFNLEE